MTWLSSFDQTLFRAINSGLSHPWLDRLMPFLSGNDFFFPLLLLCLGGLVWKGGARGRICALLLVLIVVLGDTFICTSIKDAVGRPRPFVDLPDVNHLVGRGRHSSMPSNHAANWFAALVVLGTYYRRSLFFMLPLACAVGLSRIYNGVHYPSDVLAGAALGAAYAGITLHGLERAWSRFGARWLPLWHARFPSIRNPRVIEHDPAASTKEGTPPVPIDLHWLRLGYLFIGALLVVRLGYIASDEIELSEDEAYQWVWSKHPALSYYSKPPLIALTQLAGTSLWGDIEFGVRFFSPLIAAAISLLLLRFFAREVNARAGFWLITIVSTTPLLAVGATLMTVDPLSVLFWTCAMVWGWRAIQPDADWRPWAAVGLWMGLGFLSKYTNLIQWLCWAVFFILWPPARCHLRRPGPWLALAINLVCALPVLVWNARHDWITVAHVAQDGNLDQPWRPNPAHLFDFLLAEAALLNPVFFAGTVWAATAFWSRHRHHPLLIFFFSMGAPLFLLYLLLTLHTRVHPNWIAPAVLPLFCLMVVHWQFRSREGMAGIKRSLAAGLTFGLVTVVILHDTDLTGRLLNRSLPARVDPLRRVRGWRASAEMIDAERRKFLDQGRDCFLIGDHYGITGLLSFYIEEARERIHGKPLVYYVDSGIPKNQFHFWPGYRELRPAENALYVDGMKPPPLKDNWVWPWLKGDRDLTVNDPPKPRATPEILLEQFHSVTDLGVYEIKRGGRVFHRYQLFLCEGLR